MIERRAGREEGGRAGCRAGAGTTKLYHDEKRGGFSRTFPMTSGGRGKKGKRTTEYDVR